MTMLHNARWMALLQLLLLLVAGGAVSAAQARPRSRVQRAVAAPKTFPFCNCDNARDASPWRAALQNLTDLDFSIYSQQAQQVTLLVSLVPGAACTDGAQKFEINLHSTANVALYRGSFKHATVNGAPHVSIQWEITRPVVKFTSLDLTCEDGLQGVSVVFNIVGTTLPVICGVPEGHQSCQYAIFGTNGVNGACPVNYIPMTAPSPTPTPTPTPEPSPCTGFDGTSCPLGVLSYYCRAGNAVAGCNIGSPFTADCTDQCSIFRVDDCSGSDGSACPLGLLSYYCLDGSANGGCSVGSPFGSGPTGCNVQCATYGSVPWCGPDVNPPCPSTTTTPVVDLGWYYCPGNNGCQPVRAGPWKTADCAPLTQCRTPGSVQACSAATPCPTSGSFYYCTGSTPTSIAGGGCQPAAQGPFSDVDCKQQCQTGI